MDSSELFGSPSPSKPPRSGNRPPPSERSKTPTAASNQNNSRFDTEEVREAALRRELEGVRNINEVIEGVLGTLERAKGNMGVCCHSLTLPIPFFRSFPLADISLQTVSKTVENASTLLNTWTRILSQTEHNQRLLLNPNWKGATQDVADMEAEALAKQQEAERRAAELERRREEARRKAEEEERKRMAGPSTSSARPGSRVGGVGSSARGGISRRGSTSIGTTRGVAGSSTSRGIPRGRVYSSGYGRQTPATTDESSSIATSRSVSSIGRGFGSTRGTRGTRGASGGTR